MINVDKNRKVRIKMKKIMIMLLVVFTGIMLTGCSKTIKLNEVTDVKSDSIKLTILGSENETINDGNLSLANGDYTKVKMTIENYGTEKYSWSLLNFSLEGDVPSLKVLSRSDVIKDEIKPGETATGYIYFPASNKTKLTYTSSASKVDNGNVKVEKFVFSIK